MFSKMFKLGIFSKWKITDFKSNHFGISSCSAFTLVSENKLSEKEKKPEKNIDSTTL